MYIQKTILDAGDTTQLVKKYDEVSIEYTGWIFDPSKPDGKGCQFDTSLERGDAVTVIGAGRLLKGDYTPEDPSDSVRPMALYEKARFTLPHTYGYGSKGIRGLVPEKATLVYELKVNRIGPQRAP
ncbi:FKBP-type peptidyl-prolyl isomeras-like protein [Boeremia exigua]|uniref:FKBP-type peptidyl-prolyl isomerase-like protein n=1 Tax=Boeremia exigua TaxID=749465 RepID=UPI001E8D31F7|nr:FKBP-type peptidyl-prolyl isomerase-like protein [Boeremia exigua]KAH6611965.1 FKBP-type peptidyl-prolyl isomeras-like protein [Boeremia exigua]